MQKRLSALLLAVCILLSCVSLAGSPANRLGVRIIEDEAFSGDESLSTVTLSEDVTYIGQDAFKNCSSLLTVYCFSPDAVIEDSAFDGVTNATVYCDVNSTMDLYAHDKGLTVKYLNAFETECDTDENACVLLPITWSVVNPMPGRNIDFIRTFKALRMRRLTQALGPCYTAPAYLSRKYFCIGRPACRDCG